MVSHNKSQPLIKINQPSLQAEVPKMQTVFHYRKPNRDKLNKNGAKIELEEQPLDEQLIEEPKELKNIVGMPDKLNIEIIEPITKQSSNFTLFDLSQNPDLLIKNLMDSISNTESNFNLNSIFSETEQKVENNEGEQPELPIEKTPNLYESLSVLEMAKDVLQDILDSQLKKLDVVDINIGNPDSLDLVDEDE